MLTVDESAIGRLWDLLENEIGPVTVTASCTDRIEREFSDRLALCAYENHSSKQIESLTFSARSTESSCGLTLGRQVRFHVSGDEPRVTRVQDSVSQSLDGMKPDYALLNRALGSALVAAAVYGITSVVSTILLCGYIFLTPRRPALLNISLLLNAVVLLTWGLSWVQKKWFPWTNFLIGQGRHRHEASEKIRWFVFVAAGVSILASVVAGSVMR